MGDSLEKIAIEKAGIIKENSKLIIGERNEKTDQVFINKAKEMSSKIIFVPDIFQDIVYSEIDYLNKNIHTSIETCKLLNLENLNNEIIKRGIKNITLNNSLFGRWSLVNNNPRVIFDSAHNEAGFISVSNELSKISYNKIYILLSFVKGKEIKNFIRHLPKNSNFYFTTLKIERSMGIKEIKSNLGEIINFDEDPQRAYSKIKTEASEDDLIIVTGSNYIAKEIFNEK